MVKAVIYLVKIVTTAVVAITLVSCNYKIDLGKNIKGSGNIISEHRQLSGFKNVTVCCGLDCEIIQGNNFDVNVIADDNLIKGIKTTVENGTLVISSEYNNYINIKSKKVVVTLPEINSLETTSGSNLTTKGVIVGNDIKIKSSSGSQLEANVESDIIDLETSSGSEMNIEGKALKLYTDSSSGSSIDADKLLANEVNSQSSSGSSTNVHPISSLNAKASSGSSINYNTNPKNVKVDESSGGSISKD